MNIVKGNLVYDIEATEAAKQAAAENIVPVEYKKGQNIVRQGEIISEEQYALIKQLGLTSDQTSMLPRWTVGILLMGLTFGAAFLYAGVADRSLLDSAKTATSVCLLTAAGVVLALICKRIDIRFNLVFLPAILGAVFLRRRTALAFGVFNSIIISFIMAPVSEFVFDGQVLRMLLSSILGTAAGILVLRKKQHRGEYVLAGTVAGFASAVVISALCHHGGGLRSEMPDGHGFWHGGRHGFRAVIRGCAPHFGIRIFPGYAIQAIGAFQPGQSAFKAADDRGAGNLSSQHHDGQPGGSGGGRRGRRCASGTGGVVLSRYRQAGEPRDVQGKPNAYR